nr:DUF2752 domain-containing protein [uncultured Ruminococcus sp.]
MKERFIKLAKPAAIVLAMGFAYLLLHELTGLALFCPIRQFLGLYCPGCGVSRMFFHLAHFEGAEAFSSNCVVFCMLPVAVIMCLIHGYRFVRYGDGSLSRFENILLYIAIGVLFVFGVVRNLYPIDILVP